MYSATISLLLGLHVAQTNAIPKTQLIFSETSHWRNEHCCVKHLSLHQQMSLEQRAECGETSEEMHDQ